jgi:hypothetical protein
MLVTAVATGSVNAAIEQVLGTDVKELSTEWHQAVYQQYAPILAASTPPGRAGRLIIKGQELGGSLNVGPSLSHDGGG